MCIIIDANCFHHLLNATECGKPVLKWLLTAKKAGLIVGGKLHDELRHAGIEGKKFIETLTKLSQAGRFHRFSGPEVQSKTAEGKGTVIYSNDPHVIALTMISGCNVVFSEDAKLGKDLRNRSLVGHRVSIYKNETHAPLLTTCRCTRP
jgi:hypothetical protein